MISIIIPTFEERENLPSLVEAIRQRDRDGRIHQIVVADGGSRDGTAELARAMGLTVVACGRAGRAFQLNEGARLAQASVLYFLHADSLPPWDFAQLICEAVAQGAQAGCFRLKFDHHHWFLNSHAFMTRFRCNSFRYGDQSLFVTKSCFRLCGGYRDELLVMEDQEIVIRLQRFGSFWILPKYVTTSARKYLQHGVFWTQAVFTLIFFCYYLGLEQSLLRRLYRGLMSGEARIS